MFATKKIENMENTPSMEYLKRYNIKLDVDEIYSKLKIDSYKVKNINLDNKKFFIIYNNIIKIKISKYKNIFINFYFKNIKVKLILSKKFYGIKYNDMCLEIFCLIHSIIKKFYKLGDVGISQNDCCFKHKGFMFYNYNNFFSCYNFGVTGIQFSTPL